MVEICSETSPTRKMTTARTSSRTDESVMSWRVIAVQMAYAAPSTKNAPAMGRKIRSGLKIGDDLQQDHQKSRAVGHELDFRLAESRADRNRLEAHAVAGLHERQRRRGGRRKSVGEQVKKLAQAARARRAQSRREVGNLAPGQIPRHPVQRVVAQVACGRRLLRRPARVPTTRSYSPRNATSRKRIGRSVLAVGIDDEHVFAGRVPDARFDGRAVAFVVGMFDDARTRGRRDRGGLVGRPVVDDEDLAPRPRGA